MNETAVYPSRETEIDRWASLGREIAATMADLSESPRGRAPEHPGHLVILGSGIGAMGFTRDAEQHIREADRVFFCVADPATEVWLRKLRPDAYDLYVLYNDTKRRYFTYTQMSEAILYAVRRGERVAVVYYGHPGIFVLSTHRAMQIARREGHRAEMKPGISALDCLCADLGVDPAYPGLHTYEATDLLLRRRPIQVDSHLILWQVGLIGDLGFRRRGFINKNFDRLIHYLEDYYGRNHEVIHYIGSRYPTLPPVIEYYRIHELYDSAVRSHFTGISTFYLAPKQGRPVDRRFAEEVGILKKTDRTGSPRIARIIDRYGPVELKAIEEFADFKIPPDYHFQRDTRAAEFLIALAESPDLRRRYAEDPKAAVSEASFPGLSRRERILLASRHSHRLQVAAKGRATSVSPGEQFVIDLMTKPALAKAYNAILVQYAPVKDGWESIDQWIQDQGYTGVSSLDYGTFLANVQASMLVAWTGIYVTSGAQPTALIVFGNPSSNASSQVFVNATLIAKPSFANTTLTWSQADGNPTNGSIVFELPQTSATPWLRSASGTIWTGSTQPAPNFNATEEVPPDNPLGVWIGEYQTQVSQDGKMWTAGPVLVIGPPTPLNPQPSVTSGSQTITSFTFANNQLSWGSGNQLTFAASDTTPGSASLAGQLEGYPQVQGTSTASYTSSYQGEYVTQMLSSSNQWNPYLPTYMDDNTLVIGHQTIQNFTYSNRSAQWSGAGGAIDSGDLTFSVNTFNNQPMFQGFLWPAGSAKPTSPNFQGILSLVYLQTWSGTYNTTLNKVAGPLLFIQGQAPPDPTNVFYNGTQATYSFVGDLLSGQVGASTSFAIVFSFCVQNNVVIRVFQGQLTVSGNTQTWASSSQSNDMTQWPGQYSTIITNPDGSTVAGPDLVIAATAANTYTVTLVQGATTSQITNSAYTPEYDSKAINVLSWTDNTGTPSNQFPNAAISLVNDPVKQTKAFSGSFWAMGSSPPANANWSGAIQHSGADGAPWYIPFLMTAAGIGAIILAGVIWKWFYSGRIANQLANDASELEMCIKKNN